MRQQLIGMMIFFTFSLIGFAVFLTDDAYATLQDEVDVVEVHLIREYLDGEKSFEVVRETVDTMDDFWSVYGDWQLVDQNEDVIKLHKKIEDISPLLKSNGYFGLSHNGILTIFEGKPTEEKAIQSFYQVDIEKLESKVIDRLKAGIPIKTKKDFVTVISELKRYEK